LVIRLLAVILLVLTAPACEPRQLTPAPVPTVADVNAVGTAVMLTQNAPPPPYNTEVRFAQIDDKLEVLSGWRYVVRLEFDGVFARTTRTTQASASAEVQFNQLGSARRVRLNTAGELIGQTENNSYEAVRLGPDAFLVRDQVCQSGTDAAALAADLRAGTLVGGVARAVPAGRQSVVNGEPVFRYDFSGEDLVLPSIRVGDGGSLTLTSGELWFSAVHNAVVRFWVNLDVRSAFIFDRQLPIDGTILIRYDLYDVGTAVNISVPFGC
jgi:hypothetical protein